MSGERKSRERRNDYYRRLVRTVPEGERLKAFEGKIFGPDLKLGDRVFFREEKPRPIVREAEIAGLRTGHALLDLSDLAYWDAAVVKEILVRLAGSGEPEEEWLWASYASEAWRTAEEAVRGDLSRTVKPKAEDAAEFSRRNIPGKRWLVRGRSFGSYVWNGFEPEFEEFYTEGKALSVECVLGKEPLLLADDLKRRELPEPDLDDEYFQTPEECAAGRSVTIVRFSGTESVPRSELLRRLAEPADESGGPDSDKE